MRKCLNVKMNRGFTLVEMMVTVLIFSIVVGVTIGVFVSAIRIQRYNLAYQQLLDQTSYAMEYMSRAIRMAVKDDGTCGFSGYNYDNSPDETRLEFKSYNPDYGCQEFSLKEGRLKVENKGVGDFLINDFLTSDDFDVTSLNFKLSGAPGSERGDNLQPRVTIFMEIQGKGAKLQPKITMQTTISQRNLDF